MVRDPDLAAALGVKVVPESNKAGLEVAHPEDGVSKIFKLHRDSVFADFAHSAAVVDPVSELIAPDIDVFLSQFIFKTAGAWGQPWHQDSFYFPFEPARPVVGVWLAVTEATLRQRLPARAARVAHRAGAHPRPGPPARRQLRLLRDRRPRHARRRSRCSWTRATCWSSTAT